MEIVGYLIGGLTIFWFVFGVLASKASKRPYDKDSSLRDGAKSVGWFIFALIALAALGFIWWGIKMQFN